VKKFRNLAIPQLYFSYVTAAGCYIHFIAQQAPAQAAQRAPAPSTERASAPSVQSVVAPST